MGITADEGAVLRVPRHRLLVHHLSCPHKGRWKMGWDTRVSVVCVLGRDVERGGGREVGIGKEREEELIGVECLPLSSTLLTSESRE